MTPDPSGRKGRGLFAHDRVAEPDLAGDLFGFTKDDFIDQIQDIIIVGEFCEKAAGGEIIFP